jgi:hypothetical protein
MTTGRIVDMTLIGFVLRLLYKWVVCIHLPSINIQAYNGKFVFRNFFVLKIDEMNFSASCIYIEVKNFNLL